MHWHRKACLQLDDADQALPALIGALLPTGIRGLVVAGLLAALMSSLSSVFNSCATLITMDVYKKIAPQQSDKKLVRVGQLSTVLMVLFGLAWIPLMDVISSQLYIYLQSVQAYISPPIAAVFLVGILWPRANSKGALAALGCGFVLGIGRLVLEMNKAALDGTLATLASINFLHFAILLFVVSVAVLVLVSAWTAPPDRDRIAGIVLERGGAGKPADPTRGGDLALSACVLLLVAAAWLYFS